MSESRRGREIPPPKPDLTQSMSSKEKFKTLAAQSAKYLLQDYLAQFTDNRGPVEMKQALEIIERAKTLQDLSPLQYSPYKLVRDAAYDEMRVMQGLPPDSESCRRRAHPEVDLRSRMSVPTTARQLELEPVNERFDVHAHGLSQKQGSVHTSYTRFSHSINHRTASDLPIRQANPHHKGAP